MVDATGRHGWAHVQVVFDLVEVHLRKYPNAQRRAWPLGKLVEARFLDLAPKEERAEVES